MIKSAFGSAGILPAIIAKASFANASVYCVLRFSKGLTRLALNAG